MSIRESIGTWRRATLRLALAGAVAAGLSATVQPTEAQAHSDWVGPAIVGFALGTALTHHAYKHRHYKRKYAYGYPYHRHRHYNRRVVRYGYPGPMVPYGYGWGPPAYYGPGIYFAW